MADSMAGLNIQYGRVGPAVNSDGTQAPVRLDRTGSIIAQNARGWWHEAVSRGNVYVASVAVAGVAPGTALSSTAAMVLWNPLGSGKDLSILQVGLGYVSGQLGAGSMVHAMVASQGATQPTATALTIVNARLNSPSGGAGRAFVSATTMAATPTLIKPSFLTGAGTITTAAFPQLCYEEVAGSIIVPPGVAYVYEGIMAAGSSPLVIPYIVWEEGPSAA